MKNTKFINSTYIAGGLLILFAALLFSSMNAIAKFIFIDKTNYIPALQLTFARYVIASILIAPFIVFTPKRFKTKFAHRYILRTLAGFGGIALMFIAVRHIPLAAATAIGFTSPIFTMLFAAILLGEYIGSKRWVSALIGLIGAIIITDIGNTSITFGSLIAIGAAVFMGAEIVGVKWLSKTPDHSVTILFYSNFAGAVISFILALPSWVWPTLQQTFLLVSIGLVAVLGQACVLMAMRRADANFLAPFFYASLIYSALFGFFIFDENISMPIALGSGAIVISAFMMMRSHRIPIVTATSAITPESKTNA